MSHRLTRWLGSTLGTIRGVGVVVQRDEEIGVPAGLRLGSTRNTDHREDGADHHQTTEHYQPTQRTSHLLFSSVKVCPRPGWTRGVGPSPDDFRALNGRQTPGRPGRRPRQVTGDSPRGFVSPKRSRTNKPRSAETSPIALWYGDQRSGAGSVGAQAGGDQAASERAAVAAAAGG